MDQNQDLARKYIEYIDLPEDQRGITFDDFYDWVEVPYESRTDFATAAILNRAEILIKEGY